MITRITKRAVNGKSVVAASYAASSYAASSAQSAAQGAATTIHGTVAKWLFWHFPAMFHARLSTLFRGTISPILEILGISQQSLHRCSRSILCCLIAGCWLLVTDVFAQTERGRILSTSEQQYVNLVRNGSLEAFSAGASLAPDGYAATGLNAGTGSVASDVTAKFQTYAVKLTQTNATGTYILRYDTAITGFGASLTGASADLTTTEWQRLILPSTNGYVASAWIKLPGGSSNPSAVTIKSDASEKVYIEIDSDANNDYCYIYGIQATEGPLAPAYANAAISDTTDQKIFGDITIQDNDSTNYIVLDKDTGNITMSGTLTATATNADTLDALDSTQFLRSDTADEMSGTLTFSGVATDITTGANEHLALMPNGTGNVGIGTTGHGSALTVAAGDISIDNTKKINLEGSAGDTFMYRTADNRVVLAVDGIDVAEWLKK